MRIIDSHVHIYPEFLRKEQQKIAEREPWFALLSSSKVQKWGTAEELVAAIVRASANGTPRRVKKQRTGEAV